MCFGGDLLDVGHAFPRRSTSANLTRSSNRTAASSGFLFQGGETAFGLRFDRQGIRVHERIGQEQERLANAEQTALLPANREPELPSQSVPRTPGMLL